jgi:hypothetical protein
MSGFAKTYTIIGWLHILDDVEEIIITKAFVLAK